MKYILGGEFNKSNVEAITMYLDGDFEIESDSVYYMLIEKRGNKIEINGATPDDEMVIADRLDHNWIQCQNCTEAWCGNDELKNALAAIPLQLLSTE